MQGNWNVKWEGQTVGWCRCDRQGLYIRFACQCQGLKPGFWRLRLQCGEQETDIGLLVAETGGMGLTKRIAEKHLPTGAPTFFLIRGKAEGETFVPIRPEQPFPAVSRLTEARFARRDGEPGILIS